MSAQRLLLDVSSLMYRAFFAMGDTMSTPDGKPIGAVHGYLDMVARLIAKRRPSEIVHCYDHEWRPTERTDMYPGYKANRPPEPEGLPEQFVLLRRVLDLTGMTEAQTLGWEAEDAMAAFCAEAHEDDRIEMVSGDRDLIQLVRDPVVKLLYTVRGVSDLRDFDEAGVSAKYGVPPQRYIDFAILRGDPSDALPGVKGVGEKTALALVLAYPDLGAMLDAAATEPIDGPLSKPSLRTKLLDARDYIVIMLELVPAKWDAPLEIWGGDRDDAALQELADELGIRGPVQRLLAALDTGPIGN
ncbi:MAG: flap endonuclease [Actinobacteria bacterium]|nr:flap endonuclease [Actinomycetota bacterium]